MTKHLALAFVGLAILGACVTREPEPCTSEWVDYKTDRVLDKFARINSDEIRRLKVFGNTLNSGDVSAFAALQVPTMIKDFQTLATSFESIAMPELNSALGQCGTVESLVPAFTGFLRDQGVSENILEWVEFLGRTSGNSGT